MNETPETPAPNGPCLVKAVGTSKYLTLNNKYGLLSFEKQKQDKDMDYQIVSIYHCNDTCPDLQWLCCAANSVDCGVGRRLGDDT